MSDDQEKPSRLRRILLGSEEQEEQEIEAPESQEDQAVNYVSFGVVLLFFLMFFPYVSFDTSYIATPVYPQGESFNRFDVNSAWDNTTMLALLALCVVFVLRFKSRRTAWPYRLMWACVVLVSVEALYTLMVLYPGYLGYYIATEHAYGEDAALRTLDELGKANSDRDSWAAVTDVNYYVMLGSLVANGSLLRGAWYARRTRRADKAALARYQREIIDQRRD